VVGNDMLVRKAPRFLRFARSRERHCATVHEAGEMRLIFSLGATYTYTHGDTDRLSRFFATRLADVTSLSRGGAGVQQKDTVRARALPAVPERIAGYK